MIYYDLLSELKLKTKLLHDALESVSYAKEIMSAQINKSKYNDLIHKSNWIYNQIEPSLNNQLSHPVNSELSEFSSHRSEDLRKDLLYTENKKVSNNFPSLSFQLTNNSPSELVGILYVMEGARLGGKVIVKALRRNENLKEIGQFNFYTQEGIDTGQRWKSFQEKARTIVSTEREGDRAVEAASRIFHYFHQVFSVDK